MTRVQPRIGLLVALPEELAQIQRQLARLSGVDQVHGRSGRDYELYCHPIYEDLTIACGTSSGLGLLNAHSAAHRIISDVSPGLVVMTGIAGSLSEDAQLGDAVIASATVHYLAEAKVVDKGRADFRLHLDGHTIPMDPRLTATVRRFIDELYQNRVSWRDLRVPFDRVDYLSADARSERRKRANLPQILFGKIASGDITCGSKNFQQVLINKDRKFLAIDMESAGVAAAATDEGLPWLFVRGISDYSDQSKTALDNDHLAITERVGPWRRHAAEFAGRILVALLPHLAHSLRLGDANGIAARERVLQLGQAPPSPTTLERRIEGAFPETRVESFSTEIISPFEQFCDRFLIGARPRVYALDGTPKLCAIRTAINEIEIHETDERGREQQQRARISGGTISWAPDVDSKSEKRILSVFNQVSLRLARIPVELDLRIRVEQAAIDVDGNVTLGYNLYLRRFSRMIDTSRWSGSSSVGDMSIELVRMLGATESDGPALVRAIRKSISLRNIAFISPRPEEADSQ